MYGAGINIMCRSGGAASTTTTTPCYFPPGAGAPERSVLVPARVALERFRAAQCAAATETPIKQTSDPALATRTLWEWKRSA